MADTNLPLEFKADVDTPYLLPSCALETILRFLPRREQVSGQASCVAWHWRFAHLTVAFENFILTDVASTMAITGAHMTVQEFCSCAPESFRNHACTRAQALTLYVYGTSQKFARMLVHYECFSRLVWSAVTKLALLTTRIPQNESQDYDNDVEETPYVNQFGLGVMLSDFYARVTDLTMDWNDVLFFTFGADGELIQRHLPRAFRTLSALSLSAWTYTVHASVHNPQILRRLGYVLLAGDTVELDYMPTLETLGIEMINDYGFDYADTGANSPPLFVQFKNLFCEIRQHCEQLNTLAINLEFRHTVSIQNVQNDDWAVLRELPHSVEKLFLNIHHRETMLRELAHSVELQGMLRDYLPSKCTLFFETDQATPLFGIRGW